MEIERKFLVKEIPKNIDEYDTKELEQAYLNRGPVVRIRKEVLKGVAVYYLTYKGAGMMAREEYNLPLNEKSYEHLKKKADGSVIHKLRHLIPYGKYMIELDEFINPRAGEWLAEVEFESVEEAEGFVPPEWLSEDVTQSDRYHNATIAYQEK